MKSFLAIVCLILVCLYFSISNKAVAAPGDRVSAVQASYSSASMNNCVRGSIAHSKARFFVCYTTNKWKKVTIQ